MDHASFVGSLAALYGGDTAKAKAILGWAEMNIPENLLQPLYNKVLENEQFFPMPVVLKKHLDSLVGSTAHHAFRQALNAAARYGNYASVSFENSRIAETIRIGWGSWSAFGLDDGEEHWRKVKFENIYNGLSGTYEPNLTGLIEESGAKKFDRITIGEPRAAITEQTRKQIGGKQ